MKTPIPSTKILLALATLVASIAPAAAAPSLAPLTTFGTNGWLAPGSRAYLAGTAANAERGIAFANGHLYLVSRTGGNSVRIINPTTGADIGTLSLTGVSGGSGAVIDMIGTGADGAIYVGNLVTNATTSAFKIYKWDTEATTTPAVVYSGAPLAGARIGDSLDVFGSGADTRIVAGFGATPAVAGNNSFAVINPAAGTAVAVALTTTSPATLPVAGEYRLGITFVDSDTLYGSQGSSVVSRVDFTGATGVQSVRPATTAATERPMDFAVIAGTPWLATVDSVSSMVRVYDVTVPGTPVLKASATTTTGTLLGNGNGTGGVAWGAVTGTTATLFAMSTNQGIQALTFDTGAPPVVIETADVVIEEVLADNADGIEDEDTEHPHWIELYNGTATPRNLTGLYLSDSATALTKWPLPAITIPARGYQLIFASGKNKFGNVRPHTNFTLPKTGGTVYLTAADGTTILSQLAFGPQQEDTSYGKKGVDQTPGFLETPTPGAENAGRQAAAYRLSEPVFDKPGGPITAATSLTISLPLDAPAGAELRYTTNGVDPVETSPLIASGTALPVTAGAVIKARVFAPGALPSRVGNRAFILLGSNVAADYNASGAAFSSSLPVLVMDSYGVAVDAANGTGPKPGRFTEVAVYDVDPLTHRSSLAAVPDRVSRAGVHVRGQTSATQPQRPYALEFWREAEDVDNNIPLLGMPSASDWVLLGLTIDNTLMRNYLMQQLMLAANGPGAGVRCRYVEVFYNQGDATLDYSDYRGVYLLMEKIERGRERVNISKLNDSMSDPALLSGGYIVKNDKSPFDAPFNPNSVAAVPGSSRTYDIYDPEPPTALQIAAIKGWFDQMTTALGAADFGDPASANYYAKWLDERSFIDKTLFQELCKEVDSYVFSHYFTKDRGGLLKAFPLWDVDRSLGNSNYRSSNLSAGFAWWYEGTNYTYFSRLDQDAEYRDRYWNRWTALRRSLFAKDALFARIEAVYAQLSEGSAADITNSAAPALQVPAARHFKKYNVLGSGGFFAGMTGTADRPTWRAQVDAMKTWLGERLEWIDQAAPLRANIVVNAATNAPQFGGNVPVGYQFRFENPNPVAGDVLYTIDGPDPRQTGGGTDPAALTAGAKTVAASVVLPAAQTWKWLLPASAPSASWITPGFDDSAWASGVAPLGYGEASGLTTNISPTVPNYVDANNEPGPAYFRTTFTATGVASLTGAVLEIQVDDGAVIYLNGEEVGRFGYPYAPTVPTYTQEASGPTDTQTNKPDVEALYNPVTIDASKLLEGANTLAVEVHQAIYSVGFPGVSSSDMRFDCRISGLTHSAAGPAQTLTSPGAHVVRSRVRSGSVWSPLTEATFVVEAEPASAATLVVSELHYHPADPTAAEVLAGFNKENDFEFVELLNISTTQALDLTGVKLEGAVDFDFTTSAVRFLSPGARVVVVENPAAFASRLKPGASPVVAGAFAGNFSNKSETLTVRAPGGAVIKEFTYHDDEPWPNDADGKGYSLVLNDPSANPDHNLATSWHASGEKNGNPGSSDHTLAPALAGWSTDSDDDGLSDGVEYAMGAGGANPPLPVLTREPFTPPLGTEAQYTFFRFQRNLQAEGVTYIPEISTDLQSWDGSGLVYVSTVHNPADQTATVTYRSTTPATPEAQRKFWHVRTVK